VGEKLLQVARVGLGHHLGHVQHVLAWAALKKAMEILSRPIRDIVAIRSEMGGEGVHKLDKALG
jgi:hypothetical protein